MASDPINKDKEPLLAQSSARGTEAPKKKKKSLFAIDWSKHGFGPKFEVPGPLSVEVSPGDGETRTGIYGNFRSPGKFVETFHPDVKTYFDVLVYSTKNYGKCNAQGKRTAEGFEWITYEQLYANVQAFGSGLVEIKAMTKDVTEEMDILGLMGRNHPEWTTAEFACFGYGGTTVPFYDSLSAETLVHIIDNCGLSAVVCDDNSAKRLIETKKLGAPTLSLLIVYGLESNTTPFEEIKTLGEAEGLKVVSYNEVLELGQKNILPFNPSKPDQIFSFVFTSGSTGKFPKAALIKHSSVVANINSIMSEFDFSEHTRLVPGNEHYFSYLPCAHAMERITTAVMYSVGGSVAYSRGIREKVLEELLLARPTFFASVPRILNRIHDKLMSAVMSAGGLKKKLFLKALKAKKRNIAKGYLKHPIWDKLIFNKVKAKLGLDRVTKIVTGSAPISAEVLDFYRAVFGVQVGEGYGATEMTCVATGTHPFQFTSGNVGGPALCAEFRLVNIESMPHYNIKDKKHNDLDVLARGEICVRGLAIMREYYRNPEATKEVIDEDGFYHSGDVGALLPDGSLKIIDRKSSIKKLSNGEYFAPEEIENKLLRAPLVAQVYVHGDSFHARLVAVIVPDPDTAIPYAKANNLPTDIKELCANEQFNKAVMEDLAAIGKKDGLRGFELPYKIYLEPEPFTDQTVLTTTLKLQRTLAFAKYGDILNQLLGDER